MSLIRAHTLVETNVLFSKICCVISEKIPTEVEVNASVILCCFCASTGGQLEHTVLHMSDLSIFDSALKKCTSGYMRSFL